MLRNEATGNLQWIDKLCIISCLRQNCTTNLVYHQHQCQGRNNTGHSDAKTIEWVSAKRLKRMKKESKKAVCQRTCDFQERNHKASAKKGVSIEWLPFPWQL